MISKRHTKFHCQKSLKNTRLPVITHMQRTWWPVHAISASVSTLIDSVGVGINFSQPPLQLIFHKRKKEKLLGYGGSRPVQQQFFGVIPIFVILSPVPQQTSNRNYTNQQLLFNPEETTRLTTQPGSSEAARNRRSLRRGSLASFSL